MKTGIQLIKKERREQRVKHGYTITSDRDYVNGELVQAAKYCLESLGRGVGFTDQTNHWPGGWSEHHRDTIRFKDDIGKLTVAGAFYLAENDRLRSDKYLPQVNKIARKIDKLLKQNKP